MSNIQYVVREWAWVTAMQNNPSLQTYHLEANKSLLFSYLHSQEMLVNPKTVSEALMFALQHGNRLENGFELCAKADERLVAGQAAQAAAKQTKREESARLQQIADANEVHRLCRQISEYRGGSDPNAVKQELARISHWTLAQLREYAEGIARQRAAKGLSASQYRQQLAAERPVTEVGGFPALPERWTRTAIRTASVDTLKKLLRQYGKTQLDQRLQMVEEEN